MNDQVRIKRCVRASQVSAFAASAIVVSIAGAGPADHTPNWPDRIEWAEEGPAAREHQSLMIFGDQVAIFGGSGYEPQGAPLGDAWAFDLVAKEWRPLKLAGDVPEAAGSRRVAQTPGAEHAFLFGGYGANFAVNNELFRVTLDGETLSFTRLVQVNPPPARALHVFAFDAQVGALVVSHGAAPSGFLDDTWIGSFDEDGRVEWAALVGATQPSARFGAAFGFDSDRGELLMLSGQVPGSAENPMPMTQELWALQTRSDPPAWTEIKLDAPPAGRRNPMFAFDDEMDRLVMWCGTADARTNVPGLVTVYRDEYGAWRVAQQSDHNAPPRRSSGVGFADPHSDLFYFGFGNSREGRYTDWVTLNLTPVEH